MTPKQKMRLSVFGVAVLCVVATFAEVIAPYNSRTQNRQLIALPPAKIHFLDHQGQFHWRPFVYQMDRVPTAPGRKYRENWDQPTSIEFLVTGEPYKLLGLFHGSVRLFGLRGHPPRGLYLLGTDHLGRDVFSRLVYGSRVTLSIALTSLLISLIAGLTVGSVSGYFGGGIDVLLMRFGELIQSIPAIFLILALRAAFPLEISFGQTLVMLVGIFAFASWPEVSRLVRGNVLSLMAHDFVVSAKAAGASDTRVIRNHILPNTLTPAFVQAAIIVPSFILGEAALSFLGVGIREPEPSWGNMLAAAQDLTVLLNAWWLLTPGGAIILTVVTFNALGNAARDLLDPRLQGHAQGWG